MVILNFRSVVSLTVAMLSTVSSLNALAGDLGVQQPTASIGHFLKSHCLECHSDSTKEGTLDITTLKWEDGSDLQKLVRVFERVREGEMPPKSEPVLPEESKEKFLSELSLRLNLMDKERIKRDGRAMKRRLNRYEYENTLRDLLNLPWIQIRDMLPEDGELYRFNKSGEALDVSHVQLSRYLSAADYALRQAMMVRLERPERTAKRYYARDEFSLTGNFLPRENGTLPDRLSFPVLDSHAQPDVRSGKAPKSSPELREPEAIGRVSSIFSDAGGYSWSQFRVPASGKYKLRFKGYSIWVSGGGIGRWFYEGFGNEKAPVYQLPLWHRPNADEVWSGRRPEPIGVYAQSSGKSRPLGVFDFGIEPTECEIEVTLVANEVVQTDGLRLFRLFVAKLLSADLPAKSIVDSDFTYLNERLAYHYGIPGVQGAQMRYVVLPSDSLRGGLMTQASVLKVTANGTTTSPVVRGNWIAERILGVRIAPPPSVPAVEPDIRGTVTIRQQLEKHRSDASCASCHARIDPPGFALEAFDVMGGLRKRYRAVSENVPPEKGVGMNGQAFTFHYGLPVDCAGTLADGQSFQDVRELKEILLRDEKSLARNLTCQLAMYATGAPISFSDRESIEQILELSSLNRWGVRTIIHSIVQSDLFLSK